MRNDDLREALAAYAHDEAWSGWMHWLFEKGTQNKDGTFTIEAFWVERWRRQMGTAYASLSETEKASDRTEADKIMAIVQMYQESKQ